ncbi:Homeobox protein tos8 [Marasmius sp. AFHP31]|nr:Homeobox protein tos8 [Marasmius sp. AFHP31]
MGDRGAKDSGDKFWQDEGQGTRAFSNLDEFVVHLRQYGQDVGKAMGSISPQIAPLVLDVIQLHLDRQSDHVDRTLRRAWIKCLLHLNKHHGSLPTSIHLSSIVKEGSHPVAGGGFADIWKGHIEDGNLVCLKVLRIYTGSFDEKKLMAQVGNEVLIWRQLRHPNIHHFLGVVNELFQPSYCIISPWMSNGDVMSYCRRHNSSLDAKVALIQEMCEGLRYLHEHSPPIVHSDIKGANILVSDDGHCRISDFGLSTIEDDSSAGYVSESTSQAAMRGSVPWLAPELMNPGCVETPNRTTRDIYALGCTIYELLSGSAPFADRKMELQIVLAVLNGMRPTSPAECPDWLWKIIENCWSEEAGSRLTASEVTALLARRSRGPEGVRLWLKPVDRKHRADAREIPFPSRNDPREKSEEMSQAHSNTRNFRRGLLTMIRVNRIRVVLTLVTITITILLSQPQSLYFKTAPPVYDMRWQNEEFPPAVASIDLEEVPQRHYSNLSSPAPAAMKHGDEYPLSQPQSLYFRTAPPVYDMRWQNEEFPLVVASIDLEEVPQRHYSNLSSPAPDAMEHGDEYPHMDCSFEFNADIGGICPQWYWLNHHSTSTSGSGFFFTTLAFSIAFLLPPLIFALLAIVGIELSLRKTRGAIRRGTSAHIGGVRSLQQEKKRHVFVKASQPSSRPSPPQIPLLPRPTLSPPPVTILGVSEGAPSMLESMWLDTTIQVAWRDFRGRVRPSQPKCVYSSSRSDSPETVCGTMVPFEKLGNLPAEGGISRLHGVLSALLFSRLVN